MAQEQVCLQTQAIDTNKPQVMQAQTVQPAPQVVQAHVVQPAQQAVPAKVHVQVVQPAEGVKPSRTFLTCRRCCVCMLVWVILGIIGAVFGPTHSYAECKTYLNSTQYRHEAIMCTSKVIQNGSLGSRPKPECAALVCLVATIKQHDCFEMTGGSFNRTHCYEMMSTHGCQAHAETCEDGDFHDVSSSLQSRPKAFESLVAADPFSKGTSASEQLQVKPASGREAPAALSSPALRGASDLAQAKAVIQQHAPKLGNA